MLLHHLHDILDFKVFQLPYFLGSVFVIIIIGKGEVMAEEVTHRGQIFDKRKN